jgi:hypothetical protein
MDMRAILAFLLLVSASVAGPAAAAPRVGDFALLDQDGYFHQMSYYSDHAAIALLVQTPESKATRKAIAAFQALQAEYAGRIQFFLINPTGSADRAAARKALAAYASQIPVLMDDTQMVSESLGIDKAGEAFLFDPRQFTVLYRGPVEKHLGQAIAQVLAGQAVARPVVEAKGEPIAYPAAEADRDRQISYSREIAPLLAENCARCHREGGIAPFPMNSHGMIVGWSPMIREVVLTKRMPPGQIDPHIGQFKETYTLTPRETQTLIHWINAGSPRDGDVDPLTQLVWPTTKWAFGEPDLVIRVPPQQIPATGVLDYIRVSVPVEGLDRDRWVRASQYIPGDRTVLHHTLNSLTPPGADPRRRFFGEGAGNPDAANITAYIPGAQPAEEPPNTGGLLQAGSTLNLQLHYTTNGKATVDASEIGVWFYPDDEIPAERMSGACACVFTRGWVPIPPYASDHEMSQTVTVRRDARLYSMLPHMHFRGKRMRFYAEYPDGSREELLNIAKYNYNWQLRYELVEPKLLPAGTKITAVAAYDNSKQNLSNPDPGRTVPWGQQSWDEMFFGSIQWKYVDQSRPRQPVTGGD